MATKTKKRQKAESASAKTWRCSNCGWHDNPEGYPACQCGALSARLTDTERALANAMLPSEQLATEWRQLHASGADDATILRTVIAAQEQNAVNYAADETYTVVWRDGLAGGAGVTLKDRAEMWLVTGDEAHPYGQMPDRKPDLSGETIVQTLRDLFAISAPNVSSETYRTAALQKLLEPDDAHQRAWRQARSVSDKTLTDLIHCALTRSHKKPHPDLPDELTWVTGPETPTASAMAVWCRKVDPLGSETPDLTGAALLTAARNIYGLGQPQNTQNEQKGAKQAAKKKPGTAWTQEEKAAVLAHPVDEAVRCTGRSREAVLKMKRKLTRDGVKTDGKTKPHAKDKPTAAKPNPKRQSRRKPEKRPAGKAKRKSAAKKKPQAASQPTGPDVSVATVALEGRSQNHYGNWILWRVISRQIDGCEFVAIETAADLQRDALGEPLWCPVHTDEHAVRKLLGLS